MSRGLPLIVARADPGGATTVERAAAMGLDARHQPLFAARALAWAPPSGAFDALMLTSAQAARLAGPGLAELAHLPAYAVGAATAAAAGEAGLVVEMTGHGDAQTLIDAMAPRGIERILWLCGRERSALDARGAQLTPLAVYGVDPVDPPPDWVEAIARPAVLLAHSVRGAGRIAALAGRARAHLSLVAISAAVAKAAGEGWREIAIAEQPDDASLLAAARILCQKGE